jgi:hypothetical protein
MTTRLDLPEAYGWAFVIKFDLDSDLVRHAGAWGMFIAKVERGRLKAPPVSA